MTDRILKVVLSIAGSDSGGGAGIQADIKTLASLGVYGCTVVTAVTAQNTQRVSGIFEVSPKSITDQIRSILDDMRPNAIKIGMVYNKVNIHTICRALRGIKIPIVLDPIMSAGSGKSLLQPEAFESFRAELIPLSTLITPNQKEAEMIAGHKVLTEVEVVRTARKIKSLGTRNVIIKGNRFRKNQVTDILLDSRGTLVKVSNPKLNLNEIHGTGCNFSAALAAFLSKGLSVLEAFKLANRYVRDSLQIPLRVGKGLLVSSPTSSLYDDANRYLVLKELREAISKIEVSNNLGSLIPETQSNIAYALPDASELNDVAAVRGRIVRIGNFAKSASSIIDFGVSNHVASAILGYMTFNRLVRSAMNIKYDKRIKKIGESVFRVSNYDRRNEPRQIALREGMSVFWGIKQALDKNPEAEMIYHEGAIRKEPMCIIFGSSPLEVVDKVRLILSKYLDWKSIPRKG